MSTEISFNFIATANFNPKTRENQSHLQKFVDLCSKNFVSLPFIVTRWKMLTNCQSLILEIQEKNIERINCFGKKANQKRNKRKNFPWITCFWIGREIRERNYYVVSFRTFFPNTLANKHLTEIILQQINRIQGVEPNGPGTEIMSTSCCCTFFADAFAFDLLLLGARSFGR